MFNLDRANVKTRDEIIFGEYEPKKYCGGIRSFNSCHGLDYRNVRDLINLNFLSESDAQNAAPSAGEIADFMWRSNLDFRAHGYAVSADREDYRVTLEGVEYFGNYTVKDLAAFVEVFRFADELTITSDHLYAWYD